jgi:glutathione S-transferase
MFTIYGVPLSIHVRKVIVAALEKRLEHNVEVVFPFDPPPGWRDLSPTGKIPALKHGGLTLADSSVIVAYWRSAFRSCRSIRATRRSTHVRCGSKSTSTRRSHPT